MASHSSTAAIVAMTVHSSWPLISPVSVWNGLTGGLSLPASFQLATAPICTVPSTDNAATRMTARKMVCPSAPGPPEFLGLVLPITLRPFLCYLPAACEVNVFQWSESTHAGHRGRALICRIDLDGHCNLRVFGNASKAQFIFIKVGIFGVDM